jgi:probable F420-dependent oxidoreductase
MKFATGLAFFPPAPFDPAPIIHYAQAADRVGFESLWIPEHVAIPHDYQSRYPYRPEGKLPGDDEDMNWPEPLLCLSYVAAVTKKIRLGTIVIILPLRHPLYIAKEMATLDVLSGGRANLGIGSGWLKEEFEALGLDFHVRGKRTDESIEALRALWRDATVNFSGEHFKFGPLKSFPKPVQRGGIPIFVGGNSAPALRRVARYANGYIPVGAIDEAQPLFDKLKAQCAKIGRNPAEIELCCQCEPTADAVKQCEDAGVTRVITGAQLSYDNDQMTRDLEKIGNDLIAKFPDRG